MKEKIISLLKNTADYISGEELSRKLGISRAAVWKNIQELRRQGYQIKAATNVGYRLAAVPDRLLASEIQAGLETNMIGRTILCHETVGSTMEEAFRLANSRAAEGTVVCAEGQTKGRGRMGRSWVSPKGKGIYFSVILRPKLPVT
ncbi:MAG TPA: HTH domain-containing protein, partial [Oscillospiraceae bacterium]|nr:HTH domain-containing protein [Oscillospiraceae bacterium]